MLRQTSANDRILDSHTRYLQWENDESTRQETPSTNIFVLGDTRTAPGMQHAALASSHVQCGSTRGRSRSPPLRHHPDRPSIRAEPSRFMNTSQRLAHVICRLAEVKDCEFGYAPIRCSDKSVVSIANLMAEGLPAYERPGIVGLTD